MEEHDTENRYYDAEGELYASYLRAQMNTWRWRWRRQRLLLTAEPESLSEAAALIELIYEFSLSHRIDAERAVARISDIFEDAVNQSGRTVELMAVANAYHEVHAAYWRDKLRHSFGHRWLRGLEWGFVLAVLDGLLVRTHLLTRPYRFSFMALLALFLLLGVFPLVFAWLSAPKVNPSDRIVNWRMR